MLALPSLPCWLHMTEACQSGCLLRAHCPAHIKFLRVTGRGSPEMSPVGCKQKVSFRHKAVEMVPVSRVVSTQIQMAAQRGYCLDRQMH